MPKMKSHRSAQKRFKRTGSGKLMRNQAGRSHLNNCKRTKRKRSLDSMVLVSSANFKKLKIELPYMKYCK